MNKNQLIKIGDRIIGEKTFVIAEAGVNHGGSLQRAKEHIVKAAQSGADAVKFQTYKAEKLVTKQAPRFWDYEEDVNKSQYEAYVELDKFPYEYYPELFKTCEEHNIEFMSTPFDFEAVDMLDELGMRAFKISSSDITYHQFLEYIAKKGKPIFLSTGASTLGEIGEALSIIKNAGNDQIVLLQCTLCYPTKPEDANLRVISSLEQQFGTLVGLSDHTLGITAPIIATALGAKVIEKHFTIDKTLKGNADHWLSVNPAELKQMVEMIRETEKMMGSPYKQVFEAEQKTYKLDKRSIVANKNIIKGEKFTKENLTCKRPGTGIAPKFMNILIGKKAKQDIKEDTTIIWTEI